MKLTDAKILITGGGRGIGNFLAMNLLEKGARVIVLENDDALLTSLPSSPGLKKYKCDVTQDENVQQVVHSIFEKDGGVNVLVNNAGIIHSEPLINIIPPGNIHSLENWNRVIELNLNSVFRMTAHVVNHMVKAREKGVIINVSSIAAQGNIGQSAYSASKAAVEALTMIWCKELAMFKIRSVCLAPGFMDTPSTRQSLRENTLSKWEKATPSGRLGQLDELLSAVTFMIENDFFNGKILPLDGGLVI